MTVYSVTVETRGACEEQEIILTIPLQIQTKDFSSYFVANKYTMKWKLSPCPLILASVPVAN